MKRALAIAVAIAFAPVAGAQLYKYVDKDGKTVYTDQPPANVQSKPISVPPPPPMPASDSKNGTTGNKSALERDKELEKSREQGKEAAKKQGEAAEKAKRAEQRCTQAQSEVQRMSDGGRLMKYNDKGERVYLSDEEIASGREKARQEMDEACKKS